MSNYECCASGSCEVCNPTAYGATPRRNPWHRRPFAAFDIESTGISADYDRIVTATLARIDGPDVTTRSWLVNPGVEIPQGAIDVHGITNEHAQADGMRPFDALTQIAEAMQTLLEQGMPVVAYNGQYDFTMLNRESRRHGVAYYQPHVVDPFVIDKQLDKFRKGRRTLTACCEHYGVRLDGAHDATQDALAAARVAWRLAEQFPDEVQVDPAHLHANQIQWKREQAESFGAYLVRQGKPDDVAREWPVSALPADWSPERVPEVKAA